MLRLFAFCALVAIVAGCDARARTTNTPAGTKTEIKVDADRRPGVDVEVRPGAGPADKRVDVDLGQTGKIDVDVNADRARERQAEREERREERREEKQERREAAGTTP